VHLYTVVMPIMLWRRHAVARISRLLAHSYCLQAHIFDRAAEETMLYLGAKVGFWRGDIKVRLHILPLHHVL
jgi:hypothetical protein